MKLFLLKCLCIFKIEKDESFSFQMRKVLAAVSQSECDEKRVKKSHQRKFLIMKERCVKAFLMWKSWQVFIVKIWDLQKLSCLNPAVEIIPGIYKLKIISRGWKYFSPWSLSFQSFFFFALSHFVIMSNKLFDACS